MSVEYLGYQLTDGGIGPQPKKIEAMDRVLPPKSSKQLQRILGMVNFHRNVFKRRNHILAPLNALAAATAFPARQQHPDEVGNTTHLEQWTK